MRVPVAVLLVFVGVSLAGCSESSRDSDGDGIYDAQEKHGWLVTVDLMDRRIERHIESDPNKFDTDGDGLSDLDEFRLIPPLDPTTADTDGDGLTDCQESLHSNNAQCLDDDFTGPYDGGTGTDASKADSDPGFSRYVTEVLGFEDETGTLNGSPPMWGDGISDFEELNGFVIELPSGATRFVKTDPRDGDTDGDALEDGQERFLFGSDPTNMDTDGDSCDDGHDPIPDHDEKYRLQLDTFKLLRDQDVEGGADLRFEITIAEVSRSYPASGTRAATTGQEMDISGYSGSAVRPPDCNYSPSDPWLLINILVYDDDPTSQTLLDIDSASHDSATARVWWNVREDTFSWTGGNGNAFQGPVHFRGLDGELSLDAAVE